MHDIIVKVPSLPRNYVIRDLTVEEIADLAVFLLEFNGKILDYDGEDLPELTFCDLVNMLAKRSDDPILGRFRNPVRGNRIFVGKWADIKWEFYQWGELVKEVNEVDADFFHEHDGEKMRTKYYTEIVESQAPADKIYEINPVDEDNGIYALRTTDDKYYEIKLCDNVLVSIVESAVFRCL